MASVWLPDRDRECDLRRTDSACHATTRGVDSGGGVEGEPHERPILFGSDRRDLGRAPNDASHARLFLALAQAPCSGSPRRKVGDSSDILLHGGVGLLSLLGQRAAFDGHWRR